MVELSPAPAVSESEGQHRFHRQFDLVWCVVSPLKRESMRINIGIRHSINRSLLFLKKKTSKTSKTHAFNLLYVKIISVNAGFTKLRTWDRQIVHRSAVQCRILIIYEYFRFIHLKLVIKSPEFTCVAYTGYGKIFSDFKWNYVNITKYHFGWQSYYDPEHQIKTRKESRNVSKAVLAIGLFDLLILTWYLSTTPKLCLIHYSKFHLEI